MAIIAIIIWLRTTTTLPSIAIAIGGSERVGDEEGVEKTSLPWWSIRRSA